MSDSSASSDAAPKAGSKKSAKPAGPSVTLNRTSMGGSVAAVTGLDPGGHTASFRFLDPDYGPVFANFDGHHGATVSRDVEHGSVIVVIDDGEDYRVDLVDPDPVHAAATAQAVVEAEVVAALAAAAEAKAEEDAVKRRLEADKAATAARIEAARADAAARLEATKAAAAEAIAEAEAAVKATR